MFASTLIVAALASTAVQAAPLAARAKPSNWANGYLEPYDTYHARYLALNCHDQHNTTFFADCCHPLLSTETLADKPAFCTPNATQIASASAYNATATATEDDGDVSTEFAQATASLESVWSSVAAATATSTSSVDESTLTVANGYAAPSTTSTWVAPTTTSTYSAPAETTTAAASSGGSTQTGGYATYFYQGGNPGACGNYNSDSGLGIAIDANGWWPNYESGTSDYCGKWITITNTNNGKSVTAQVWDVCPTCTNDNSLDLSVGAFTAIASESDGMVPISWVWA